MYAVQLKENPLWELIFEELREHYLSRIEGAQTNDADTLVRMKMNLDALRATKLAIENKIRERSSQSSQSKIL